MTFERSVKGIFGCITFCEVAVTTRTRSSEHKGIRPQLQLLCRLQPWRRHGEWGSPPENGSGCRLPFQVEGHGEPGMELAAGPRSQVAPGTRLCPSHDPTPLRGPGAVREHERRGELSLRHLCCLPDWVSEEPSGTPASAEAPPQSRRAQREDASVDTSGGPRVSCVTTASAQAWPSDA